ncbi:spore coat polysaccharide biosynthesis protein SpsF (cytidylyltransferase family) [Kluyvera sp. 1366]
MNILKRPIDSIDNLITNAIVRLEAGNEFLLKVLVTSYLLIDLS